jgi:hypothetical protein
MVMAFMPLDMQILLEAKVHLDKVHNMNSVPATSLMRTKLYDQLIIHSSCG